MRNIVIKTIFLLMTTLIIVACRENDSKSIEDQQASLISDSVIVSNELFHQVETIDSIWKVENYYSSSDIDTLLVDFVAYIYKKPSMANYETKFNPEFRQYYINNTDRFEIVYYCIKEGVHYYYLLRPARNEEGFKQRGVGGMFKRNLNNEIVDFEEVFNTVIMSADSLKNVGYHLFAQLSTAGEINEFINDRSIIEWPNGSLFYSKEKHEWRYVD
jgi:hypothetical protein